MGMKLKENFMQAAKELMGAEDAEKKGQAAAPKGRDKLDERVAELQARLGSPKAAPAEPGAATVISEGTVFTGNLETGSPVEMRGACTGNITSKEEVLLTGQMVGDASGSSVQVAGCRLKGNISAQKDVRVDGASIIIGNINAGSLTLDGKIKGDLTIKGALVLGDHAALLGNAVAASISIQEGAILQGEMKIASADLDALFKADET